MSPKAIFALALLAILSTVGVCVFAILMMDRRATCDRIAASYQAGFNHQNPRAAPGYNPATVNYLKENAKNNCPGLTAVDFPTVTPTPLQVR